MQWETLCSKGRQKPLKLLQYQNSLRHLDHDGYAVMYAKFCKDMSSRLVHIAKIRKYLVLRTLALVSKRLWVRDQAETYIYNSIFYILLHHTLHLICLIKNMKCVKTKN